MDQNHRKKLKICLKVGVISVLVVTRPKSLAFNATPGFGGDFNFFLGFGGDKKTLAFGGDTKRPTFGGDNHKNIKNGGD